MKFARFLPEKGTIGFVAPSFGCSIQPYRAAFENARKKWTAMGYQLDLGPNSCEGKGIGISNTPEACGRELMEYYLKKDNDCLISCGGGELMCEVLDYIDFPAISNAEPKWFMGYSDNTNFTFLLATLCDTASVYGPCAASFGSEKWHESLWDAMHLLTGKRLDLSGYPMWEKESLKSEENPYAPYNLTEEKMLKIYHDNVYQTSCSFSGRLLGGCMDSLGNLIGTRYDKVTEFAEKYREDGIIWFVESCDLNVFDIRRTMWQMEHAGWFAHVKGFVFGRPLCYGQELMGLDTYQAVLEVAGKKGVPVIMDADLGHLPPMMPLVVGSKATITADLNNWKIQMDMSQEDVGEVLKKSEPENFRDGEV